jgi:hypothetical protein
VHSGGGMGLCVPDVAQAVKAIGSEVPRDLFVAPDSPSDFVHRRIGRRDIYALYGVEQGSTATFRAVGKVELWDPWTGSTRPLPIDRQEGGFTTLRLPLTKSEAQIVAFSPGKPVYQIPTVPQQVTVLPIEGEWRCEPKPTLNNRWGDFHWPPTSTLIGPEARRFRYRGDGPGSESWTKAEFDDAAWETYTCGFGPKFRILGPLRPDEANADLERRLLEQGMPDGKTYAFSWRWGVDGDRGHQGYHGLKELVSNEFIRLGKPVVPWPGDPRTQYVAESGRTVHYLWSTVLAPRAMTARVLTGGMKPSVVWINGRKLGVDETSVEMSAGPNRVLLRYDQPGTGYFVVVDPSVWTVDGVSEETEGALAMDWASRDGVLLFDVRPDEPSRIGWFRFKAPPGLRAMEVPVASPVRCWVNGREINGGENRDTTRFELPSAVKGEAVVALRIEQKPGEYAGNAIMDAVRFECGEGEVALGDWSQVEGLSCYSGGLWYRTEVEVPTIPNGSRVYLDLGRIISSAEVRINGKSLGAKIAPPWKWEVTKAVRAGKNRIEVLVYNTLANHYATIPTGYRGDPSSGIIGPASLAVVK